MLKIYLLISTAVLSLCGYSQILMNTSGSTSESTCGDVFYDSGGSGSNYSNSENGIKTFYPSGGDKVIIDFSSYSFDVESGWDFLYIYDGNSTAAPQVAGSPFSGTTNPGSFTSTASDGSITIELVSDGSITRSGWGADISCTAPSPMAYSTTTTVQTNSNVAVPGTTNQEIIGVNVQTTGSASPLDLTEIQFNMNGTTSTTDVSNISIYYTGSSNVFSATGLFGTASPAAGTITVTGTQTLAGGDNYFWIAYNISGGAVINNFVDAECTQVTLTTAGNQVPSPTSPAGNRKIDNLPPTYLKRIGNSTAGTSFWARNVIYEPSDNTHMFIASGSETGKTAGGSDMCLIKVTSLGDTVWTRSYGTANSDIPYDICKTSDGGYVIVGQSNFDFAVALKVNASGVLQWRTFIDEGSANSAAYSVIENSAGDIIVAGKGESTDMYAWRLDPSTGALLNSKEVWWSAANSEVNDIIQTSDGGYLLVGVVSSDFAAIKLTSTFTISWRMKWGGGSTDELETVIENSANDFTVFGGTYSLGSNSQNMYAMRFSNSTGTPSITWENTYDGGYTEGATKAIESGDGGYIMVGLGTALGNTLDNEGCVAKINSSGVLQWDAYIGMDDYETYCIAPTGGGGYAAGGLVNDGNTYMFYLSIDQSGYNCNNQGSGLVTESHSSTINTSFSTGVNNGFGTVTSTPGIASNSGYGGDEVCTTIVSLELDPTKNIEKEESEDDIDRKLSIYPVPNNGVFKIDVDDNLHVFEISINSLDGKLTHLLAIDDNLDEAVEINASGLNNGVYLVQVVTDAKVYRRRITIVR